MKVSKLEFSVVIPALNEESTLRECLRSVRALDSRAELIVVDGRSDDRTVQVAHAEGASVFSAPRGRGHQLNAGARFAHGDILVFLHADTRLPAAAFDMLRVFFQDERVQIGTFRLAFDERHWLLGLAARFSRFDSIVTSSGDQCIVVRRKFFEAAGGFPEWPLFEDVHFLRRARKLTRIHSFPATVITSARRFKQRGFLRQFGLDAWYLLQYLAGVSPERLAMKYEGRSKRWSQAREKPV